MTPKECAAILVPDRYPLGPITRQDLDKIRDKVEIQLIETHNRAGEEIIRLIKSDWQDPDLDGLIKGIEALKCPAPPENN